MEDVVADVIGGVGGGGVRWKLVVVVEGVVVVVELSLPTSLMMATHALAG